MPHQIHQTNHQLNHQKNKSNNNSELNSIFHTHNSIDDSVDDIDDNKEMLESQILRAKRTKIELLPNFLINQIKAGEVIERPANLIKEILENSIDADASEIKIHIANNGLDFIEIVDNGIGILYEDLPLAFSRHTTSKISSFNDLYDLHSFGFRGEALASIAAVSRVTMISFPIDSSIGGKIVIEGGEIVDYQQMINDSYSMPESEQEEEIEKNHKKKKQGTSIYISDLFYNTPARLKFIKAKISEKNAIKKIINAFVLSCSDIAFEIKWDSKDKIKYSRTDSQKIETVNIEIINLLAVDILLLVNQ